MAEKKQLKKTIERLIKFEEYEKKCLKFYRDYENRFVENSDEDVKTVVEYISGKKYITEKGALANLYLAFMTYADSTSRDNRKTIEGITEKYRFYSSYLKKVDFMKMKEVNVSEDYLTREALILIVEQRKKGEGRFNDVFNSEQMIKYMGEEIRYCPPWKKWLIWDGCRWLKDEGNEIYQIAINNLKNMMEKALYTKTQEEAVSFLEHACRSESVRKIEAVVKVTGWDSRMRVMPEDLDCDNYLFNCSNGIIDLNSGRLYPHERGKMITKKSEVPFYENENCPVWKNFLKEIFAGNKELYNFIHCILGMSLTGDISAQAIFILYGTGANGKSTFINTIMKILGDYALNTPAETFLQKKGDQASNDIARLKGTRFVSAVEVDYGGKLAEAVIKRLTGNDIISARFLYGEYFDFYPTFKIFMATNHKPKIGGLDNAIWRRIKLIPFVVTFPPDKQDKKLQDKLDRELPGILSWMVRGCLKWQKEGLPDPPVIKEATEDYKRDMSAIESFISACCKKDVNDMCKSLLLYSSYKDWCEESGERCMSNRAFGIKLAEMGFDKVRLSTGYHWLGISVTNE